MRNSLVCWKVDYRLNLKLWKSILMLHSRKRRLIFGLWYVITWVFPLLVKSVLRNGSFAISYRDLGIIKGYSGGFDFPCKVAFQRVTLFLFLGVFLTDLLTCLILRYWLLAHMIEVLLVFSRCKKSLAKNVFNYNVSLEWSRNIPHDVTQSILVDLNKI